MLLLVSVLSVNCPKLMCRTIANKCCMCSTLLLLHIYSAAHTKQSFIATHTGKIQNVIITCNTNNNKTNLNFPFFKDIACCIFRRVIFLQENWFNLLWQQFPFVFLKRFCLSPRRFRTFWSFKDNEWYGGLVYIYMKWENHTAWS